MADADDPKKTGSAEFARLNEKVDQLVSTVGQLADVVAEDRKNHIEQSREIYQQINDVRERATTAGRITWPLIVTTFSAALGFAAIVGGLGNYALGQTRETLALQIDSLRSEMEDNSREIRQGGSNDIDRVAEIARLREWQRLRESGLLQPQAQNR